MINPFRCKDDMCVNSSLGIKLGGGNSNIFYFHPYLGKIPIWTKIFQMGWNHQLVKVKGYTC